MNQFVHDDVDWLRRFGDEPVHVAPVAVLEHLEDEFRPVLDNSVAPSRLVGLDPRLEGYGLEETAAAEPDVGEPAGAVPVPAPATGGG